MPHHPPILALGYSQAAMLLRRSDAGNVQAILSICGAREFGVEANVAQRLDLKFDDVEVPDLSNTGNAARTRADEVGRGSGASADPADPG